MEFVTATAPGTPSALLRPLALADLDEVAALHVAGFGERKTEDPKAAHERAVAQNGPRFQ